MGRSGGRVWWWLAAVAVVVALLGTGAVLAVGRPTPEATLSAGAVGGAEGLAMARPHTDGDAAPELLSVAPPSTNVTPTTALAASAPPSTKATISITITPERPKAGETVSFTVTASQPGNCCYVSLDAGDGVLVAPDAGSPSCTAGPGGVQRVSFTHVYNRPGTWSVEARSDDGRVCDRDAALRTVFKDGQGTGVMPSGHETAAQSQIVAHRSVAVEPGAVTTSQGPKPPQAEVSPVAEAPVGVSLQGQAWDVDGWVREVLVEWGDGTPPTRLRQGQPCRTGENGWPIGAPIVLGAPNGWPIGAPIVLGALPSGAGVGWTQTPVTHRYTRPGAYTTTVTVVSTGCDGDHEQRTQLTVMVTAP